MQMNAVLTLRSRVSKRDFRNLAIDLGITRKFFAVRASNFSNTMKRQVKRFFVRFSSFCLVLFGFSTCVLYIVAFLIAILSVNLLEQVQSEIEI